VSLNVEQARRDHDHDSIKELIGKAREDLHNEGCIREQALEAAARDIEETANIAEAQLKAHQAQIENRLAKADDLEGLIHELTDKVEAKAQMGLTDMARCIEDFRIKIGGNTSLISSLEERMQKCIGEAIANAEAGRSALGDWLTNHEELLGSTRELIQEEKRGRTEGLDVLRISIGEVFQDMEKCKKEQQQLCADVATEEAKQRKESVEEMRRLHTAHAEEQREWARLLIEQLSKDLRAEHEASASDERRRGEDAAHEGVEKLRLQLTAEVSRVETSALTLIRAQETALGEDRSRRESEAQHTASEVRDCLTSHSDFMEALEREQTILINRLNEGLSLEDQKRDGLEQRLQAVESDVQKVRGHLPILFAVPTAFR